MVNSEADIQDRLYRELERKRHKLIVPNVMLFGWESDLVSVTAAGFICEYEIKCSRSDFKNDAHKYQNQLRSEAAHDRGPAYFYYVVPRDLVMPHEVPRYAGLIFSHPMMQVMRPAPKLHRNKVTDKQRDWLTRGLAFRYWKFRLKARADRGHFSAVSL